MDLRAELIEFLIDWHKENPMMTIEKIERKIDMYLIVHQKL